MLFSFEKVSFFDQKTFNVIQIKEIHLDSIDFDRECGQFIAKIISNDGKLTFFRCKTTKPGYETLSVELGNKQVIKAEIIKLLIKKINHYLLAF